MAIYEGRLRQAGRSEAPGQLFLKKLLLAFAVPFVPLLPIRCRGPALTLERCSC